MRPDQSTIVKYVRRSIMIRRWSKVIPYEDKQTNHVHDPSTTSFTPHTSVTSKQMKTDYSPLSISKENKSDKEIKCSKISIFVVIIGIFIGAAALSGLVIGIYSAIRQTTSQTVGTAAKNTHNISLRWQLSGTTVAGVWNSPGINSSKFNAPFRVILDSSNTLYISDYANHRVQKFFRY